MSNILEERQKNRWLLLRKVYEIAEGISEKDSINVYKVGEQLGWSTEETEAAFDYLQGEGLLQGLTVGGGIKLTYQGVKEVEDYQIKPTLHFSVPIANTAINNRAISEKNVAQTDISTIPIRLFFVSMFALLISLNIKPEIMISFLDFIDLHIDRVIDFLRK
jgi:hypothetical protein